MTVLYSQQEIRELEELAKAHGFDGNELMSRAGHAAFSMLKERYPEAKSILVACGMGNNGGDGYVLARLAHEAKINVYIRYVGNPRTLQGEAKQAYEEAKKAGCNIAPWNFEERLVIDVIVDALMGIGLKGELKSDFKLVIAAINETDIPVMALDMPSGLLVDTGNVAGTAINADSTITFIGIKQGMMTGYGPELCGELYLYDLDLPEELFNQVSHSAVALTLSLFENSIAPRMKFEHKGDFGHVLIVGGAPGMNGAPILGALAAARVGAGLVSVATDPAHAALIPLAHPEIMSHGVKTKSDIKALLAKVNVVVVGPGLGQSAWAKQLMEVIVKSDIPIIVDADALNWLSEKKMRRTDWVLTPHPGEAARLLQTTTHKIQSNRFSALENLRKKYGGVVVLKGSGTLVGSEEVKPLACVAGNPGMASGGMGDLLSGVIAGLVAQGMELPMAAAMGVCIHATAGDQVARLHGERGMLATDLLPTLTRLVNQL